MSNVYAITFKLGLAFTGAGVCCIETPDNHPRPTRCEKLICTSIFNPITMSAANVLEQQKHP